MYAPLPPNARPFSPKALCVPLIDVITVAEGRGWDLQSSGSNINIDHGGRGIANFSRPQGEE
jgi:hypothetical protein